jgi:hypothetical protein
LNSWTSADRAKDEMQKLANTLHRKLLVLNICILLFSFNASHYSWHRAIHRAADKYYFETKTLLIKFCIASHILFKRFND